MKEIRNPWTDKDGYNCFGCSPDNPIGLHLHFFEDGDDIVATWQPSANYQGWLNTLHGGITATLIDEVAGWVVTRKLQTAGVTARLNLRLTRPVATDGDALTVRARISASRPPFVTITATVTDAGGNVCATGEALYRTFDAARAAEMGFTECKLIDEDA